MQLIKSRSLLAPFDDTGRTPTTVYRLFTETNTVAEESLARLAHEWRTYCQQQSQPFRPLRGSAAARARIEQWEEQLIEQIDRKELPLTTRAIALRSIIELRGCAARVAATFFAVEPQVVVLALSLLELPPRPAKNGASIKKTPTAGKPRSKVALPTRSPSERPDVHFSNPDGLVSR